MDAMWQDVRFAVRTLAKSPAFALAAVVSLALGIGANTTIFTLINAVFLTPLPVERPSELVAVYTTDERNRSSQFGALLQVSFPNFRDFRDQNAVFEDMAAYSFPMPLSLSTGAPPEPVFGELVTGNYFALLGVKAARGRFFLPEEDSAPGAHPVVVLSHGLWQRRFGGEAAAVGRTISLNGTPFTIIGIAPEGFKGVNAIFSPDLWAPSMMHAQVLPAQFREWFDSRRALLFSVAGRLRAGTTREQAQANLETIAAALEREYPEPNTGRSVALRTLTEATIFPALRGPLMLGGAVLMTVVGLVLLIACANVANLLLARASGRRQEIAVRTALGAGRVRLVRQLLTESIILALAGGGLGMVVAYAGRDLIWSFRPPVVAQNLLDLTLDARVLGFALGVSVLTGIVFGLAPALQASRADVVGALKEETRTAGRSRRGIGLGRLLVVGQVALSLVSLVAAGLFLRSLGSAHEIDPGFETRRLAIATTSPGQAAYDRRRAEEFYRVVRERVEAIPGVRAVSWSNTVPLFGSFSRSVWIEGQERDAEEGGVFVIANTVAPGFFETTGIRLLRGRDFTMTDREGTLPVAIINQTMADRFWPDQEALGRRFRFWGDDFYHEIVGVAATSKYNTIGESPQAAVYVPLGQNFADTMTLFLRTESDPAAALGTAQREIRTLDSQVPVTTPFTMPELIEQSLWTAKLAAMLLGILGLLALALASVGLYGVMAYSVAQRQHEIGLRMALGAGRRDVLRLVLRQGMLLVAIGLALGLAAALAVSRAVATLLYGVSATDPTTFLGVSLLLALVALVASAIPAVRASRLDPLQALR